MCKKFQFHIEDESFDIAYVRILPVSPPYLRTDAEYSFADKECWEEFLAICKRENVRERPSRASIDPYNLETVLEAIQEAFDSSCPSVVVRDTGVTFCGKYVTFVAVFKGSTVLV